MDYRKKRVDESFSLRALKKYRTGKSPVKIDVTKIKVENGIIKSVEEKLNE